MSSATTAEMAPGLTASGDAFGASGAAGAAGAVLSGATGAAVPSGAPGAGGATIPSTPFGGGGGGAIGKPSGAWFIGPCLLGRLVRSAQYQFWCSLFCPAFAKQT